MGTFRKEAVLPGTDVAHWSVVAGRLHLGSSPRAAWDNAISHYRSRVEDAWLPSCLCHSPGWGFSHATSPLQASLSSVTVRAQGCGNHCHSRSPRTTWGVTGRRLCVEGSEAAAGHRGHAGWTRAVCPGSLVKSAGTVPLTGLLDFRKSAGISS